MSESVSARLDVCGTASARLLCARKDFRTYTLPLYQSKRGTTSATHPRHFKIKDLSVSCNRSRSFDGTLVVKRALKRQSQLGASEMMYSSSAKWTSRAFFSMVPPPTTPMLISVPPPTSPGLVPIRVAIRPPPASTGVVNSPLFSSVIRSRSRNNNGRIVRTSESFNNFVARGMLACFANRFRSGANISRRQRLT